MKERLPEKNRLPGIRMFLILAVVMSFFLAARTDAYAADGPTISSPDETTEITVGKEVTISVKAKNATIPIIGPNYFVHFKITKNGEVKEYVHEKTPFAAALASVTMKFTPQDEGVYLIEVCETKENENLPIEAFKPQDEVTITAKRDISQDPDVAVTGLVDKVYTGSGLTQTPVVQIKGKTLDPDTDYNISYENNVNVGTATVKITGKGYYKGTVSANFQITPKDIAGSTVSGLVDREYDGTEKTQSPVVVFGGKTLQEGADYNVTYENNVNAGTATVNINGSGNYTGSVSKTFKITPISIAEAEVSGVQNRLYSQRPQIQDNNIVLKYSGKTLNLNTDYTLSYKDNTRQGTATVTITGKGNFKNSVIRTFSISENAGSLGAGSTAIVKPADGGTAVVAVSGDYYQAGTKVWICGYTGIYQYNNGNPDPNYFYYRVSKDGKTVLSDDGKTPLYGRFGFTSTGAYVFKTFIPTATGEYLIELSKTTFHSTMRPEESFQADLAVTFIVGAESSVNSIDISQTAISGVSDKNYTGNSITQTPTVKVNGTTLKNGTDYYLTYTNNINVGTAKLTVRGKGKYKGSKSVDFQIKPKQLTADMITLSPAEFEYTGNLQKPTVVVKNGEFRLVEGRDYTLTNEGGKEPGEYQVTIAKGTGSNYEGTASKKYYIGRLSLDKATVTFNPASFVYDGTAKEPAVTVKLGDTEIPASSYKVAYSSNTNAGKGKATITANSDDAFYRGSVTGTFDIEPFDIRDESVVVGPIAAITFNRTAQTPKPFVLFGQQTLKENTDYTLSYSNNTNVGQAIMKIVGKGNFKETRVVTFSIDKKDISDESIIVNPIPSQKYEEGSAATPEVIVKDGKAALNGDEISVEYKDNDKVGTATVTIKGKGNYTGSREATFEILEANDYAVYQLSEKVNELEKMDISEYLPADKEALQAAIDFAKELLADGNASIEDLEKALAQINQIKDTADTNLARAKAEEEARRKAEEEARKKAQLKAAAREKAKQEAEKKEALSKPSAASVEKKILSQKTDKDPAGSAFLPLQLKSSKQAKNSNSLTWKKVPGTTKYVVYGNKCGKTSRIKKLATVKKTAFVHKKLKKGTYYKYVVIAVKKTAYGDRAIAISKMIHVATKGGKVTNDKKITVRIKVGKKKKAVSKAVVKKGKKLKLLAAAKPASGKQKVKKHVAIRYESSKPKVAAVSSKGVVTGKGKGTCYVYVYAQNGRFKKIKVTVK